MCNRTSSTSISVKGTAQELYHSRTTKKEGFCLFYLLKNVKGIVLHGRPPLDFILGQREGLIPLYTR